MNRFVKFCVIGSLLVGILVALPYSYVAAAITPQFALLQFLHQARVDKEVIYCSHDVPLKMDIYYPIRTDGPIPAIIYVHGGGWYSGDKETGNGRYDIASLVDNGYLVAAVNYRLAPRYKFPAQIEDIKCAVRFLRANAEKYHINPDKIGAYGDSAGGHLVSLLAVTADTSLFEGCTDNCEESESIQAVVDIYGPSDLAQNFEDYNSLFLETVFDTTDPNAEILKIGSPVTYVSNEAPPFLIIHGDKDDVVSFEQSQILYERLISSGVSTTLLAVKNAGHLFKPIGGPISPTRTEITGEIVAFFDQYLK